MISVIIPTYQREPIRWMKSVKSVLNQSYQDFEIILVDDNVPSSKYRANNIKYIKENIKDLRFKYLQNIKNIGGSLSRNEGINAAKGEYIAFLDDDDEFMENKLASQFKFMQDENLDGCFSDIAIYDANDQLQDYRRHEYIKGDFSTKNMLINHILHNLTPTSTYMFRKDLLVEIGGFDDEPVSQDFYLMLKAITSGRKIGYQPICTAKLYRDLPSISTGSKKIVGEKKLYSIKKEYYHLLKANQRRYVRCRFYSVLAVAQYRSKKYLRFGYCSLLAFLSSPITLFREIIRFKKVIKEGKSN